MSSDGSVMSSVSRIRQFGLYRSIDARTEEFLRASRKRQIRQGCACAAVSTAITVTVVVSVILVYEYSINGESNHNKKFTLKPNWIGFMNESTDVTQVNSKFTKKINIDKTTIKLLPLLIKALNKNRYIEKLLDDYSSTSPAYERKDTTEFSFNKNVFNKKKWIKMPTSRLYTTDYKSSPTLIKLPTNSQNYFRNRRKMKDYQRMLNYFDKMVGDKKGSSEQINTNIFESTDSSTLKHYITPPIKSFTHETATKSVNQVVNDKNEDISCKCPKNLGEVLNKLDNSLRGTISNAVDNNIISYENKAYTGMTTDKVFVKNRQRTHTWKNAIFRTTSESIPSNSTHSNIEKNVPKMIESSTSSSTDGNIIFHKIYFPENNALPLTPYFKGDYNRYYSFHGFKTRTIPKDPVIKTTKENIADRDKTVTVTTEYLLHQLKVTPVTYTSTSEDKSTKNPEKTSNIPPDYDYFQYDNDNETITPKYIKAFKNIKNPVSELVTTKEPEFDGNTFRKLGPLSKYFDSISTLNKKFEGFMNTSEGFYNIRKTKLTTHSPPKKVIEPVSTPATQTAFTESQFNQVISQKVLVLTKKAELEDPNSSNKRATGNIFTFLTTDSTVVYGDPTTQGDRIEKQDVNVDSIIADTDLDKVPNDEFPEETSSKQLDNIIEVPSDSDYNNSKLLGLLNMFSYNNKPLKSMLPPIRPVYLEVQRFSDWRHDYHHDYDFTENNNAFEMPDI